MVIDWLRWLNRYQAKLNDMGLFLLALGVISIVASIMLTVERSQFARHSVLEAGRVDVVVAENDTCGRRRSRYDCTKFEMQISYSVANIQFVFSHHAGSVKGPNQTIAQADYHAGEVVAVRYRDTEPREVYLNDWVEIFQYPIAAILFGLFLCYKSSDKQFQE